MRPQASNPDFEVVLGPDERPRKPNPACYVLGAVRLGLDQTRCLVLEDAIAGILAGEGAGANVTVIGATHHAALETLLLCRRLRSMAADAGGNRRCHDQVGRRLLTGPSRQDRHP
ncbi:HAD-IA family hydrolase [Rhizobium leguminosarum]|nr:HAD-IA family hydrolase [Rhizobium leguminosarum]